MKGVILAAGKGSRLNGTAGDKPKCLVEAGGITLLERQIRALERAGIDDIVVVVGCQADRVRAELWAPALRTLRMPGLRKPTACIPSGRHELCYMRDSWC